MKRFLRYVLLLMSSLLLVGCKRSIGFKYIDGKVNIVVTTTMIGDLTKEIGKDNVSVTTLMNVGVDPHSYVPRPSVTRAINEADLVITNGLNLEAKMGKVLQVLDDKLIELGSFIPLSDLIQDEHGQVDPHIWFNVNNWIIAARELTNKLIEIDLENKDVYLENFNNYQKELIALNNYVIEKVSLLAENERILITAHDAFSYFGEAYGFRVYSIQGISTETEASAKNIKDLVSLIVKKKVKAVFLESSVPENTIKAVINAVKVNNHEVVIGGLLYSDSLGKKNSDAENYLKMVKYNVDKIVEGLM